MRLPIPAAALAQHTIALGKTGAGKSSVLRLLVESQLAKNEPVCVIDPKGDWWGLKSSADGKSAGYPVVIFGGEHSDVPINAMAGAQVAELYATGNRPCIIDLGGWSVADRTRFFIDFAGALFRLTRGPRWIVIDEVHNFAPQGKVQDPQAGKMLHWTNRLITEGRGKGLTVLSASQRPQKVHKDFVTSNETLIAMRVIHPLDRNAIKEWIDGCPDREKGKEVLESLASMKRGEGWVWSPEIGFGPKHIAFPLFETFDSFAAPKSEADRHPKGWAEVNLDEVRERLAASIEQAKQDDPKLLRAELAALKRELSQRAPAAAPTIDPQALEQEYRRGHADGVEQMRLRLETLRNAFDGVRSSVSALETHFDVFQSGDATPLRRYVPPARPQRIERIAPRPAPREATGGALPVGERAVLTVLCQYPGGARREQISILTGYKRSSRDAYIQRLREKGYAEANGDTVLATDAGVAALGPDFEPLPTGPALQRYWLERLPEGERAILNVLLDNAPKPVEREDIDRVTGYKRSSRDAYIQRLKARQLVTITGRGEVRANEELFA